MTCRYCGNEIRDDARFCPHCGAVNRAGAESPAYPGMSYPGPEAPKKKKTGLLIGGAVAAVAVIALIIVAVSGLFSNPKGQVEKAMVSSYAAYETAEKKLGMPEVNQWQKDRSIFQSVTLHLNSINSQLVGYDLSALSGLELGASVGYDGQDRYMNAEVSANWDSDELFLFRIIADDAELYFYSPQLTGSTHYGVNTETLGADLTEMTGDDSMEDLSFNLFHLTEAFLEEIDQEAVEQAVKEANKALWADVTVKKEGTRTLNINGAETKTSAYQVTIPQKALEDYADALIEAAAVDYVSFYREMYRSIGLPEADLEDFLDELEELDPYGSLAEDVKDAIAELGDVELEVCLSGGHVSAVLYEGEIHSADVKLALYLGGNGEYVDDLSAELKVNSTEITVESNGDHGLKNGAYTDETTVRVRQSGVNVAKITSKLSYDPRTERNNFQWELGVDSSGLSIFGLATQGDLAAKEDGIELTLEDVTCKVMRMEVCGLGFHYQISRCPDGLKQPMKDSRLVMEMNSLELMVLANELQSNAETWVSDMEALFAARLPEELLYGLVSGYSAQ